MKFNNRIYSTIRSTNVETQINKKGGNRSHSTLRRATKDDFNKCEMRDLWE